MRMANRLSEDPGVWLRPELVGCFPEGLSPRPGSACRRTVRGQVPDGVPFEVRFDGMRSVYVLVGLNPASRRARTALSDVTLTTLVRWDLVSTRGRTVLGSQPLLSTRQRTALSFS